MPSSTDLTGAASLHEQLDKQVVVSLRDGRNFVGRLGSYTRYR
jgi:small nuclear ribonucleoprotein (snRNP)-like protein